MKLSIAYPIMTTAGFAIVILASKIFFHEDLNLVQWIGIALLAAGIWLVAFHAA
jgi:multidrug transporter EmrE-like cation transporter